MGFTVPDIFQFRATIFFRVIDDPLYLRATSLRNPWNDTGLIATYRTRVTEEFDFVACGCVEEDEDEEEL